MPRDTPRLKENNSWAVQRYRQHRDTVYAVSQPVEQNLMVFGKIRPKFKQATKDDLVLGGRKMKVVINQGKQGLVGEMETDENGHFASYFPDVEDDHTRSKWFSRYLDCDEASLELKNSGYVPLRLYAYLGMADSRFARTTGVASPFILNVDPKTAYNRFLDLDLMGKDSSDPRTVCVDGPSYDGRPIVWIIDGAYRLVTGLRKPITDFKVFRPTQQPLPLYMDEVRCIYITQDPEAFRPYVRCSVLEKKRPTTVFITTHPHYIWDDSVLFSTFFDGFSE